jgi:hypothetical protein
VKGAKYRGQPLLVLLILLGGWVGLRTVLWQSPFAQAIGPARAAPVAIRTPALRRRSAVVQLPAPPVEDANPWRFRLPAAPPPAWSTQPLPAPDAWRGEAGSPTAGTGGPARLAPQVAAGHELMLLAAFSQVPLPGDLAALLEPAELPQAAPFQAPAGLAQSRAPIDRWSADAWLLLRKDTTMAATSGRGSYGQSQAGAVIRYHLAPSSGFRPTAYLRASQALAADRESETALGLAARPIPGLPLSAAAELRAARAGGRTSLRPAVFAVTELPPAILPFGFTGEAYAQAGYVWGDYETAFVDGEIRAERKLLRLGPAELRIGGGVWGGAQKGAERLDVGPGATLALKIGQAPSRVSMDWRFRVAGNANPSSGPALTLSAGF